MERFACRFRDNLELAATLPEMATDVNDFLSPLIGSRILALRSPKRLSVMSRGTTGLLCVRDSSGSTSLTFPGHLEALFAASAQMKTTYLMFHLAGPRDAVGASDKSGRP